MHNKPVGRNKTRLDSIFISDTIVYRYFVVLIWLLFQVFYVNIDSRESSWVKPVGFEESEDELKKVSVLIKQLIY